MKIYNRYILTVSLALLLTAVLLLALGLNSIDGYYTMYVVEALVITELYAYFNNKARRGLTFVSITLFAGFLVAVCLQIIKIIT